MGKLRKLEIHFFNSNELSPVFYSGQTVSGQIVVELNESMEMRAIRVMFDGSAKVHWTETKDDSSDSYDSSETYFHEKITLFGRHEGKSGDKETLESGRHTFKFQYTLPRDLPSSFEAFDGHVRYTIKGVIDRPWKFNHTVKSPFTVLSNLDLNTRPDCAIGADAAEQKFVCCLCCKSGPLSCRVKIPQTGYVPGQSIPITAEIQNDTSRTCKYSQAVLRATTKFKATTKTKECSKDLCSLRKGEMNGHSHDFWTGELLVPPTPPSELIHCNIIDIDYSLDVSVSPSGPALDLTVKIPIVIGTIPLREMFSCFTSSFPPQPMGLQAEPTSSFPPQQARPMGFQADGMQPQATALLPPGFENYPEAPPPQYSELFSGPVSIKGDDDNDYTMGNLNYAPVYTYYAQ